MKPARKARPNKPRTILCGSSGNRGHRPASETAMNSPARPSSSQARGQSLLEQEGPLAQTHLALEGRFKT